MASRKEYEILLQMGAQLSGSFNSTFLKAQQELISMQKEIAELSKIQSDISSFQKQQGAVEATRSKLAVLEQQYENIQKEINGTKEFSSSLENRLLSKQQQIEKTSAALGAQTDRLEKMENALKAAGVNTDALSDKSAELTAEMNALKKKQEEAAESATEFGIDSVDSIEATTSALATAGLVKAYAAIADKIAECVQASIEFESAQTGVFKTVDGTETELFAITKEIKNMTTEIPATTTEIAAVAEAAGQLGVATNDVMDFTRVMIDLGESTNLVADDAASSFAKFANITGTASENYSRLGSVVVDLGNNFATTEADIVSMSTRLASAGTLAGFSEAEIMALSAAMSSVGIEAEAGGTAMTQTFSGIEKAVETQSEKLLEFARVAEMSADEFSAAWKTSPVEALQAFISGLGRLDSKGESSVLVLENLGLTGIRQSNMLKSLGLAAETLGEAVSTANKAWDENTALTAEANKRYKETAAKLQMLQNTYGNVQVAIGDVYAPTVAELAEVGTDVLKTVTEFVEQNPELIKGISVTVGVIGTVTAALTAYTAAVKIASTATTFFASAIPGVKTIMGVIAVVSGLTGAFVALSNMTDEEAESIRNLSETSRQEYFQIQALKTEYDAFSDEQKEYSQDAALLAWEIENLNSRFEANKQTLSEYIAECNAVNESLQNALDSNRAVYTEIEKNELTTLALVNRLRELASQTDDSVAKQEAMKAIIKELNGIVPSLSLSYDEVINGVTDYTAAIEAAVKTQAAMQKYEAYQQGMIEAFNKQSEAKAQLSELTQQQAAAKERLNKAEEVYLEYSSKQKNADSETQKGITSLLSAYKEKNSEVYKEYIAARESYESLTEEMNNTTVNLNSATDEYNRLNNELKAYIESANDSANAEEFLNNVLYNTHTELKTLAEEYKQAYNAAYESVTGQYAIWNEAAAVIAVDASEINSAIESQIGYWQEYNTNLDSLTAKTAEIEGLGEIIASFADGSADSVNAIAGMAASSDAELAAMVESWKMLQEEQKLVSETLAVLGSDLHSQMTAMTKELVDDIKAMDLSTEAAQSARDTIQGFIKGAEEMLPQVQAAYESIAQAAMNAIDHKLDINSPSREMEYRAEMTWAGYINETKAIEPELRAAMSEAAGIGMKAVEQETQMLSLLPVYHQYITAEGISAVTSSDIVSAVGLSGQQNSITIAPQFTVQGGNASEIEDRLREFSDMLIENVMDALEESGIDKVRRAYN